MHIAAKLKAEAGREAEHIQREAKVTARAEILKMRDEAEAELKERRKEQAGQEKRLVQKEEALDKRAQGLEEQQKEEMLDAAYQEFYAEEEFVRVRSKADLPTTQQVQGSNYCDVAPVWDPRTKRIVVVSVIDNLVKGAAGQAIQNMNIMMGLDEGMGLRYGVMYP